MPLPNVILHINSIVTWKPGNGCWKSTMFSPDFTRVWVCALFSHVCICVTTCRISWDSELFVTPRSPLLPPKAPPTLPGDCSSAPPSVILSLWESVHRLCQSVTLWDWLLHSAWCLWDPSTRLQVSINHSLLLCGPHVTNPSAAGWPLGHLSFWPLHGKPLWRSGQALSEHQFCFSGINAQVALVFIINCPPVLESDGACHVPTQCVGWFLHNPGLSYFSGGPSRCVAMFLWFSLHFLVANDVPSSHILLFTVVCSSLARF